MSSYEDRLREKWKRRGIDVSPVRKWAASKLPKPKPLAQKTDYTCGPAALAIALRQLGHKADEKDFAHLADKDAGLPPGGMVTAAKKYTSATQTELSGVKELAPLLGRGKAVILDIQALDSPAGGSKGGHYVVLSTSADGKVTVADPMGGKMKTLTHDELVKRWHDEEASGRRTKKLAIVLG